MENKTEKTTGRRSKFIKRIAVVGGAIAIGVAGYAIGRAVCKSQFEYGLALTIEADPTLGDHLVKAINIAESNLKG